VDCINSLCTNAAFLPVGTSCDNGLFCDGPDSCTVGGACVPSGSAPCSTLTCLSCDENSDKCQDPIGTVCIQEGTFTDSAGNIGVCQGM
jgi:hypothetical protein